jgi:predicted metal-dependent hydrolase
VSLAVDGGEQRELAIGGRPVGYRLFRSARRTLEIAVLSGGAVEVRAPQDVSIARIEARITARAGWLHRKMADRLPRFVEEGPRSWLSGESVRYLGRQYRLQVKTGAEPFVRAVAGRMCVVVSDSRNKAMVEQAVRQWFCERAQRVIAERVKRMLELPAAKGLVPLAVSVRAMKNRWGSCSAAGRLLFHVGVVGLPTSLVDYVVAHELCHLRERRHDAAFERLLSRLMPDWRERHRRLADW